jgi:hypothetical protein
MCSRPVLIFASLLFVVMLAFSSFVSIFSSNVSPFATGATNKIVSNETELRNAIDNAKNPTTIALDNGITLTETLVIPTNKDITLTSNRNSGYYKLLDVTITVDGTLTLDGIIVTCTSSGHGRGVAINKNGTLIMLSGEISGNTATENVNYIMVGGPYSVGGGVYNLGVFKMYGGKISGNTVSHGYGGGVYNAGTFEMHNGEISNNSALDSGGTTDNRGYGGGVYNQGSFSMSGGKITNNRATYGGGGVYNGRDGTFNRQGGVISGNIGGDVYPSYDSGSSDGGTVNNNNEQSDDSGSGGFSNVGNDDGSANGNNTDDNGNNDLSNDPSFSLREVVIICIGVVGVTVGVVMTILFLATKTKMTPIEETLQR